MYSNWAPLCERSLFQRKWQFDDDILKQYWTTQMSNSRYISSMEMQDLNTNLVCPLHSQPNNQPPRNSTLLLIHFRNYFDARWETRLWNSRYIVRKCMIWARMWIFRGSVGQFLNLAFYRHRKSDTAGAKTSVSIYKSWMISYIL